jgi:hypothetical protein
MNIYLLKKERDAKGSRCYQGVLEADKENRERMEEYESNYNLFQGGKIGDAWHPVHVIVDRSRVDEWNPLPPAGDFPRFEGAGIEPVFSRQALDTLSDLLQGNGEILPLSCDEGEYYLFNITRIIDVIDRDHSEFKFESELDPDFGALDEDGPDFQVITRCEFYPDQVKDLTIFKIPREYHKNTPMVTDNFVRRVREAGLKGFEFELLWSSAVSVNK